MVLFSNDTLTCSQDSLQLSIQADRHDYQFDWTGPGGFVSNQASPWVFQTGLYRGRVVAANGCNSLIELEIAADLTIPQLIAIGDTLTCLKDTVELSVTADSGDLAYVWTRSGSVISRERAVRVSKPGSYKIRVTGTNGCSNTANLVVPIDTVPPALNIVPGVVDCQSQTQELTALSNRNPGIFSWTGPNDFASSFATIQIGLDGTYTVLFTGLNGCSGNSVYRALVSSPKVIITGDSLLSCKTNSVLLTGISADAIRYQWTGPDGYSADNRTIDVVDPGRYTLLVSNIQNCTDSTSITVKQDTSIPDLSATGGILPCDPGVLQLTATSAVGTSYNWIGPNGFASMEANPTVSHSGQYTVSVANADGCKTSKNIQVMDPPDIQAVINTSIHPNGDLGDATLFVSSGVGPFTVRWDNGDTSFTVTDLALGSHFVQVTDKYGCIQQFQFEIDASTAIDESSAIRQFSVFPNPVDQYLNVELELLEQTQDKRVELVDLNGKIYWHQVFSGHTLHQRIPTMNFGQGWYFLKVTTRNEHAIKPVIILH